MDSRFLLSVKFLFSLSLSTTAIERFRSPDGPVLTTTELYLLQTELQLNPILTNSNLAFHLIFHLQTGNPRRPQLSMESELKCHPNFFFCGDIIGSTSGFNPEARDRDVPFTAKDEPATLPRVQELIVICESSPWCTIVRNEKGVTLQDVCTTIWKEYARFMFPGLSH